MAAGVCGCRLTKLFKFQKFLLKTIEGKPGLLDCDGVVMPELGGSESRLSLEERRDSPPSVMKMFSLALSEFKLFLRFLFVFYFDWILLCFIIFWTKSSVTCDQFNKLAASRIIIDWELFSSSLFQCASFLFECLNMSWPVRIKPLQGGCSSCMTMCSLDSVNNLSFYFCYRCLSCSNLPTRIKSHSIAD